MTFTFTPAKREGVSLLVGLVGGTGSGKTYTAMRLAQGLSKGKPFAVIDTEAGRAKHYADQFHFDHGDLSAPFRPDAYVEAISAADKAGYPVIVVDSMSHVWAGDGGILDWQEDELDRMAGDDWKKREAVKMAAWIKPKMSHKQMVQKLLQVRAHLILCFRAEEKVEMVREDGKMKIVPKQSMTGANGWIPVCEKNLPFELTVSLLFTADAPGIPKPIKLQEQHRHLFPLTQCVDENAGRLIADWAAGAKIDGAALYKHGATLTGDAKRKWWGGLSQAERDAATAAMPPKQAAERPPERTEAPPLVISAKTYSEFAELLVEGCDSGAIMTAAENVLPVSLMTKLRELARERGV